MPTFSGDGVLKTAAKHLRRTVPIALFVAVLCGCERAPEQGPIRASTPIKKPQPSAFQSDTETPPLVEAAPHEDIAPRVVVPYRSTPKPARVSTPLGSARTLPLPTGAASEAGGTLAANQAVEPARFEALSRFEDAEPVSRTSAVPAPSAIRTVPLAPLPVKGPPASSVVNGDG